MTLAQKGRRSITVRGEDFHWVVSRDVGRIAIGQTRPLRLTLVVQRATGTGSKLKASFQGLFVVASPQKGFADDQSLALRPGVVEKVIERALALGWKAEDDDLIFHSQEAAHPEAKRSLAGDGSYDPAQLDAYLSKCVLLWKP